MQPLHTQPMSTDPQGPQPGPTMQPMGPIMQQRSDCRLIPPVGPPVSSQTNNVAYPSCMVANNSHTGHTSDMEQTDPLNYEPYIWSF